MKPEQKLFFIAHRTYQNWLDEWRKNRPDPEIKNQVRERPRKKPEKMMRSPIG